MNRNFQYTLIVIFVAVLAVAVPIASSCLTPKDMVKVSFYIILTVLFVIAAQRSVENSKYLLLFLFVITIVIPINVSFYYYNEDVARPLVARWYFGYTHYFLLMFMPIIAAAMCTRRINFNLSKESLLMFFFTLICFSTAFNPDNAYPEVTIVGSIEICILAIIIFIIITNYDFERFFVILWFSFASAVIIETILVIAFPVFGIEAVTTWFYPNSSAWIYRDDTFGRAIGTFPHPGNLALYLSTISPFFLSCAQLGFKRNLSYLLFICTVFDVFLTQSRVGIAILFIAILASSWFSLDTDKRHKISQPLIKIGVVLGILIIFISIAIAVQPLLLNQENLIDMWGYRNAHWDIAFALMSKFLIWGIGFNSHTDYIYNFVDISDERAWFLEKNPIHNGHLIYLTEVGLIGYLTWISMYGLLVYRGVKELKVAKCFREKIAHCSIIGAVIAILVYNLSGWAGTTMAIWCQFVILVSMSHLAIRHRVTNI